MELRRWNCGNRPAVVLPGRAIRQASDLASSDTCWTFSCVVRVLLRVQFVLCRAIRTCSLLMQKL